MPIAFFVNDMEREFVGYTTTALAHQAAIGAHRNCYVTPSEFVLNPDDTLCVHARFAPKKKYADIKAFFEAHQAFANVEPCVSLPHQRVHTCVNLGHANKRGCH